jgi:hypothetical protein
MAVALGVTHAVMLGATAALAAVGECDTRQRKGRCRDRCNNDPSHL